MIENGVLVRRNPDSAFVDEGDRVVVVPLHAGQIMYLIGPAGEVWRTCSDPMCRADLVQSTLRVFQDTPAEAAQAIATIIDSMIGADLLHVIDTGSD